MSEVEYDTPKDTYRLENSRVWMHYVHSQEICSGRPCTIHNRTDHNMRDFPQHWNSNTMIMERMCPHDVGHPDPDEFKLIENEILRVHECDSCCKNNK
jgi:hypothetical protein